MWFDSNAGVILCMCWCFRVSCGLWCLSDQWHMYEVQTRPVPAAGEVSPRLSRWVWTKRQTHGVFPSRWAPEQVGERVYQWRLVRKSEDGLIGPEWKDMEHIKHMVCLVSSQNNKPNLRFKVALDSGLQCLCPSMCEFWLLISLVYASCNIQYVSPPLS